jgi:hypothetical protein
MAGVSTTELEVEESAMGGSVGAVTVGRSGLGLGCFTSMGAVGSAFSAGRLDPTCSLGPGSMAKRFCHKKELVRLKTAIEGWQSAFRGTSTNCDIPEQNQVLVEPVQQIRESVVISLKNRK